MNFAEAIKNETKHTYTENGALALNTSSDALVDLYATIGSLRHTSTDRIIRLFVEAFKADPLSALKILFYGRDIREGLGERDTFRTIIKYLAKYHPIELAPNLYLFGEYGRFDDLYCLIGTPLENQMWTVMKEQLQKDIRNMESGEPISLLAKWIKTPDASSRKTASLGCLTAKRLGYTVYDFKRILRQLRAYTNVTETYMATNRWNEIDYSSVPSRSMKIHTNAFAKHDTDRFTNFSEKAVRGEVKVNAKDLYPYDIIESFINCEGYENYGLGSMMFGMGTPSYSSYRCRMDFKPLSPVQKDMLEAQWRSLPNYLKGNHKAIVMADTSGSMRGRPIATALGLAVYFAERNKGAFEGLFMTFSNEPKFHTIKGETLEQKLHSIDITGWMQNTDMEKALDLILETAIKNNIAEEDMIDAIIIPSDMEIDRGISRSWNFYDAMRKKFREHGYDIPKIVFWNVDSRKDTFLADANRKGVTLVSGQSINVFRKLMETLDMTAREAMEAVINSERYMPITVG